MINDEICSNLKGSDWPLFHGNIQQTGYTEDEGPSRGEIAWKFPVGWTVFWHPVVEDERVYVTSPGKRTILFCLNLGNGREVWRTSRFTLLFKHHVPTFSSTPLLTQENVLIRETSGDKIFCIDKRNGKKIRNFESDYVSRYGHPVFTGNNHAIVYPFEGKLYCKSFLDGKMLWSFSAGNILSEPTIENDRIFAATCEGSLYCLGFEKGEEIWHYKAGSSICTIPLVWEDNVYIGTNDGIIYCLDKNSGEVRWQYKTEREPRSFQLFSNPTIAGYKLYIGAANRHFYCLDANTGQLVWKFETNDWIRSRPVSDGKRIYFTNIEGILYSFSLEGELIWETKVSSYPVFSDLVLSSNKILVTSSDLYLYCINSENGTLLWRYSLLKCSYKNGERHFSDLIPGSAIFQSSPTVAQGKVFIGTPNHFVYAVDCAKGTAVWKYEVGGAVTAAPVFSNGRIFFGQEGSIDQDFYCISAEDGMPIWTQRIGEVWSSATVSEGRVFVPGTKDWYVNCLQEEDGRILWRYKVGNNCYASPPVYGDIVYFGSWDGYLYALDVKGKEGTGELLWKFRLGVGAVGSAPAAHIAGGVMDSGASVIHNGKIFVPTCTEDYYCLEARTGKIIWKYLLPGLINNTAAVSDDQVFINTSVGTQWLYCLDGNGDGHGGTSLMWRYKVGKRKVFQDKSRLLKPMMKYFGHGTVSGPSITKGEVFFGDWAFPFFYCLDRKTGRLIWKVRMGGTIEESLPAISGGRAFILCTDGNLYAFM